jgi:anti-sigma B factor antagonist
MDSSFCKILVAVADDKAFLKLIGRANFSQSVDFKKVMTGLIDKGFKSFYLDLTDCTTMDSTFLGVLARIVIRIAGTSEPAKATNKVVLLNPNKRIVDLIDSLGIMGLFNVSSDIPTQQEVNFKESPPTSVTKKELTETALQAHNTLIELNPSNLAKFKDVTKFLEEDLKNL